MPSFAGDGTLHAYGITPVNMVIDAALLPGGRSTSGGGEAVWMFGAPPRGMADCVPGMGDAGGSGASRNVSISIPTPWEDDAAALAVPGSGSTSGTKSASLPATITVPRLAPATGDGSTLSTLPQTMRVIDATKTPIVFGSRTTRAFEAVPWWAWLLGGLGVAVVAKKVL